MAGPFWNHESVQLLQRPDVTCRPDIDDNAHDRHPDRHQARRLTDSEVEELVTDFQNGATITQLVDSFGVHRTTVMAHLRRSGVPRLGEWSPAQVAQAANRYQEGETLDDIAATLGVDPRTVGRQLRRAGAALRPSGPRRRTPASRPV